MKGTFLGKVGRFVQSNAVEDMVEARGGSRKFSGGYVKYDSSLGVHEEGGELCFACGEPSFTNARDAERAKSLGAAAAWLTAFRRQGAAAAESVLGRFAAVLIRPSQREVFAVTDRFATYPICYSGTIDEIRFAARADDVAGSTAAISAQSLFDYLFFHVIPAPATVFEHVHRMPSAHVLEWRNGKTTCKPYWRPVFAEKTSASLAEREAEFLDLVETAVAREAESGSVGAFLSGGTDSSTIAGMLCKLKGEPAKTYSMGFDASGYDEMEYARIAAEHFGADHHEYYVTPGDVLDGLSKVATCYDQPFGNSSTVPAWICAARAREDGIDKLLAGDGGDELFGGNERYAKQRVFDRYSLLPQSLQKHVLEPVLGIPGIDRLPVFRKAASYVRQARLPLPDRLQTYNLLLRIGARDIFEPSFLAAVNADRPLEAQRGFWESIDAQSSVDHMIAFDWKFTLSDNDLPKVIGAAEMAGLNVGFPLLSDELLEFSLKLPPEWKLKGQTLRWFFKHALREFLPEAILRKQKHGFGLPFGVWVCSHTGLHKFARDTLGDLANRALVNPRFLDDLLHEHLPAYPGYYGEMVWILVVLELWLQSHAPEWRFGGPARVR